MTILRPHVLEPIAPGHDTQPKGRRALLIASCLALWGCTADLGTGAGDQAGSADETDGAAISATDPGRVTIRRLNNTEYDNTIRDLLGTSLIPSQLLPLDGSGAGFDNIADVLSLSEPHLVAYAQVTEQIVADVLGNSDKRSEVVPCDAASEGAPCIHTALRQFVPRAWRRPVNDTELSRLFAAVDGALAAGDTPEQALTIALEAVLLSPHFLFRPELDPVPDSLEAHPLTDYELASRLSYFLWSSMPDDELFSLAAEEKLHEADVLANQVDRMLGDERARALVDNFAGQWLYLRKVDEVEPDASTFAGFDDELRAAMKTESELLFEDVVFGGLPADQLLTADFTYVNDRLAEHYGLPAVGGAEFVRTELPAEGGRVGGILGHASVLTVTSHSSTTSPVLRGKWVLSQLLCAEVPSPPPDVNTNLNSEGVTGTTLRERLEQHRSDPTCATCHNLMDPIGLGLENYDAIGSYRETENGAAIDASGALPDGRTFSGPADLRALLAKDLAFSQCLVENLYTYALGRVPSQSRDHMDGEILLAQSERFSRTFDFPALIHGIVQSPTFLTRRGDTATEDDQ